MQSQQYDDCNIIYPTACSFYSDRFSDFWYPITFSFLLGGSRIGEWENKQGKSNKKHIYNFRLYVILGYISDSQQEILSLCA